MRQSGLGERSFGRYKFTYLTGADKSMVRTMALEKGWDKYDKLWVKCGIEAKRMEGSGSKLIGLVRSYKTKQAAMAALTGEE